MFENIPIGDLTGPAMLSVVAVLVITRRLVWHKDLRRVEAERDRWRAFALRTIGATEMLAEAAEVTTEVLTSLPLPPLDQTPREPPT
jgi:hypothetical protein